MRNRIGFWKLSGFGAWALAVSACTPEQADDESEETSAAVSEEAAAVPGLLDANRATAAQLVSVPGLDRAAAEAILGNRPYARVSDLHAVVAAHVAEDGFDAVYSTLWVPIDLNTATGDEILLIPGVGERMRREFEEYRPYVSMAQFRREIGKYVDAAEVERLASYVEVR